MSRSASFLRAQIERAKRFAAAMTNPIDREHFEGAADRYQRELDALPASSEAAGSHGIAEPSSPQSADASTLSEPNAATPAPDTAAPPDAVASTDDSAPTTSNDTGQQETD